MDFRWVAAITLWTFLSGPVLTPSSSSAPPPRGRKVAATTPPRTAVKETSPVPWWPTSSPRR